LAGKGWRGGNLKNEERPRRKKKVKAAPATLSKPANGCEAFEGKNRREKADKAGEQKEPIASFRRG